MRSLISLAARLGCPAPVEYLFSHAIIDSRKADPFSLFFALPGKRTDGHRFVPDVLGEGGAAVVSRDGFTGPVLEVDSVEEALLEAGSWARDKICCPVVGITGSSGKTTTRKMVAAALSPRYRAWQTEGNLNNHLGTPLTLLNTPEDSEFLVLEMGMNHPGELLRLGWVSRPSHALVTNIGRAHMEHFSSRDEIAVAKSELLLTTGKGGTAVIPAGEDILCRVARDRDLEIITHGHGGDCWFENGRAMPWGLQMNLQYKGEHNMRNAVSAIAFAQRMNVPPEEALEAISSLKPEAGRGQILPMGGITVIDESYNANPESAEACLLSTASSFKKPLAAVLGDMLELGEGTVDYHREVLKAAVELGFGTLVLVGEFFKMAAEQMKIPGCHPCPDWESALDVLRDVVFEPCTVLVKGSHSMGLSLLVDRLKKEGF